MNKMKFLTIVLLSVFVMNTYGQIAVTSNTSAAGLASFLAGSGVVITNPTLTCSGNSSGTFTNAPTALGFTDGVVLSSGHVVDIGTNLGIANPVASFASSNETTPGDADLLALYAAVGSSTTLSNDACALEFDIEVTGDSLDFNYAFGSEEYDEFVCNTYADIFAFYISGPNPAGGNYVNQNIALIPGTNIPVTVNTVNLGPTTNPGTNPFCNTGNNQYFMNQAAGGGIPGIVYDGMTGDNTGPTTIPLKAVAATVPCQIYHFKLVIADGQDSSFDSGVFLEAGSFTSNSSLHTSTTISEDSFKLYENCVDGSVRFEIDSVMNDTQTVHFFLTGSATNGVDYTFIPDSIVFLPNDTFATIDINIIADGIPEGLETIVFYEYTPCGTLGDSVVFTIQDSVIHDITSSSSFLCSAGTVQLTAQGGGTYNWGPSNLLSPDTGDVVIATINSTTMFYDTVTFGNCTFYDSINIGLSQTVVTFHTQDISCPGANDGAYWIEVNDSASNPIAYSFAMAASTDSAIYNIGPGFQLASATDAFGCISTDFHIFANPAAMVFDWDTTSISCAGANDGEICLLGIVNGTYTADIDTNGVLFNTYTFTVANDTFCFGTLGPDTYDITFTNDTTGCSGNFTASLSDPIGMSFSYDTTNISCANAGDGSICVYDVLNGNYTANVSFNGIPLPAYNFVINSDTFCIGNLVDGAYTINLVNNTTLCNVNFTANLTAPAILVANIGGVGASLCAGGSIDSLVANITGGTMPYTYMWNNSATTPFLVSPAPGTYTVIVTDQNLCVDTATYTITSPIPLYLEIAQDSATCFGTATGFAFVDSISGGLFPYSYAWDDALTQITDTASNVLAGQIILTITDANSCTISDTIVVLEPAIGLSLSLSSSLISCFGGDTCIDATVNGGTAPYTFLWNDALTQTAEDICGLIAGTYTLIVTDAKGCTITDSITIVENAEIVLTIDSTNIVCYGMAGGNATVTAIGGSGTYSYLWNDALAQTTAVANNLIGGFYTVIVTDATDASCTKTISVNVVEPTDSILIALDNIVDVSCFETATGAINVTITGGTLPYTSYAWTNGSTSEDLSLALAGIHTITVTDNNGCTMSLTDTITQPDSISIVLSTNVIDCFGGDTCIDATIVGGSAPFTYAWSNGMTTEDVCGLIAGTYTINVTDSLGCTFSESITITEVAEIILSVDSVNIDCFGDADGSATVTAVGGSGAYNYLWNDVLAQTTAMATNLVPGNYTVIVADVNNVNCTKTISVNIEEPTAALSATLANLTNVLCFGASTGSIDVSISGGTIPYSFAWTNSTTNEDLTNAAANNYTLTVTDANLCSTTYSDIITQPSLALDILPNTITDVSCFGGNTGAIDVDIIGGTSPFTYSWSNGATTEDINTLIAGSYTLTVTDSNNCVATEIIQVNEPVNVGITFNYSDYNGSNVSCFGSSDGTITAVVTGGNAPFSFAWDNAMAGSMISGIPANTIITVTVTDDNGCVYTQAAVALTEPVALSLTKDSTNVECAGDNNGTATAIPAGGTAPYTYLWSDQLSQNSATATGLAPNTYVCNVSDNNGCTETISITIKEADAIVVTTVVDSVRCWGRSDGEITIIASGGNGNPFEYSIDGGLTFQSGSVFTALTAGIYSQIIVKQDGIGNCLSTSVGATVYEPEPMFIFINPSDTTIQIQESVPLQINVDPSTSYYSGGSYSIADITNISWTPPAGLTCSDCLNPTALVYSETEYLATVTYSQYGCTTDASAIIDVENNLKYFIPNGFSPQGDGINDQFMVYGEALKDYYMIIYNRWGEKVFESNVQSQGWDGTFKGEKQNPGVYTYHFEGVYLDDKEITTKGSLTLIR